MDAILGTHRRKLAEGTVRPGGVVMLKVFGQHLAQMVLIDDQHPVEKLPPQAPRAKPRAAYWIPLVAIRDRLPGQPKIIHSTNLCATGHQTYLKCASALTSILHGCDVLV